MNISTWTSLAVNKLKKASIPTFKLDVEILIADLLEKDRSWINAHPSYVLSKKQIEILNNQINEREKHVPLAYIREKQEFYGREFKVSPDTLTPRPETETMVEMLIDLIQKIKEVHQEIKIIDAGTGSGCIIISAALELSQISNIKHQISYYGLDISKAALKIARQNAKLLKADVIFLNLDLNKERFTSLLALNSMYIITANLPYVPNNFQINLAASHEPRLAIFGGSDGLDLYRELFGKLNISVKYVLTESLPPQQNALTEIAKKHSYMLVETRDFIQLFKRV